MTHYAIIPIIALLLYLLMFLSLIMIKKNETIYAFMEVLLAMIAWTMGSFFMRLNVFPFVNFWFYFSLVGILLFLPTLYNFIIKYLRIEKRINQQFWTLLMLGIWAINCFVPIFIEAPQLVDQGYVYDFSWTIVFLFFILLCVLIDMIYTIHKAQKKDLTIYKQLIPIFLGANILILGHLCLLCPSFKGFPIDVLSGIPMAICLFYALYKNQLFEMNLLISRVNCYYVAMIIVILIYYRIFPYIDIVMKEKYLLKPYQIAMILIFVVVLSMVVVCIILEYLLNLVFGKKEVIQSQCIQELGEFLSELKRHQEIFEKLEDCLKKGLQVENVYLFYIQDDLYKIQNNDSDFTFQMDQILLASLYQEKSCLLVKALQKSLNYQKIEPLLRQKIEEKNIECLALLQNGDKILGLIALPHKLSKERYTKIDLNFLKSVSSVTSIAIENAILYEEAYQEARKDYLTGVANRRYLYEVLQKCQYEKRFEYGSFIMVSIDDFKLYNQLYGTAEGNLALVQIAHAIRSCLVDEEMVARYTGKVFAVILPGKGGHYAYQVAEQFSKKILLLNEQTGQNAMKALTVSCGIASGSCTKDGFEEVMQQADEALYYAKQAGKNQIKVYKKGQTPSHLTDVKGAASSYVSTIYALMAAIDAKDHYTFSHSENVAYYAQELAKAYGMDEEAVKIIYEAGLLHDIGKIGIDESIINKPGKLTDQEYETIKGHVELAVGIIRHLPSLDYVIPAVIGHHERYDGKGYPRRLKGEGIPLMARILCIADSFDAMVSKRSYKQEMDVQTALKIIDEEAGYQFDPQLAHIFIELVKNQQIEVR